MTVTNLKIVGMHCASCKALIEEVASEARGVTSCTVDVKAGTALVEHDDSFNVTDLIGEIQGLGDYAVQRV